MATPAEGRSRGRRLDHGRFARPSVREGHRRRAVPLGRARATRLQPESLGTPAIGSTIATMTHVDRRRGRDPEVAAPCPPPVRAAHGRCGARRPESAVMGLSIVDRGGSRRDRARRSVTRPISRPRPPTATAPGSSATALSKLDPATADELRTRLIGIRSDRALRPRRPPPRPPLASANCPTHDSTRSHRSCDGTRLDPSLTRQERIRP